MVDGRFDCARIVAPLFSARAEQHRYSRADYYTAAKFGLAGCRCGPDSRRAALDSPAVQSSRSVNPDDAGGRRLGAVRVGGSKQLPNNTLMEQRRMSGTASRLCCWKIISGASWPAKLDTRWPLLE
jgi:hypothetical protein